MTLWLAVPCDWTKTYKRVVEVAPRQSLRLDDETYKRVAEAAKRDRRSVHGELIWLIVTALDRQDELQRGRSEPPTRSEE